MWTKVIFMFFAIVIGIAVLHFISNWFNVATTVANKPAELVQHVLKDNDAIIRKYEWYHDTHEAYEARLGQIQQYQLIMNKLNARPPNYITQKEIIRTTHELAAMQQSCRDMVAKYNANSAKLTTLIFKGWSLPHTLNMSTCN